MSLTTQFVASPVDGMPFAGANVCVGSDGRAETFTVAAHVAATRVVDTVVQVLLVRLHQVTGTEDGGLDDAALLLRPRFALWLALARVCHVGGGSAVAVQLPTVAKGSGSYDGGPALRGGEVVFLVAVEVAAQTLHLIMKKHIRCIPCIRFQPIMCRRK